MTEDAEKSCGYCARSHKELCQLEALSSVLGLEESVKEEAKLVCQKAIGDEMMKGAPISIIATTSIYTACRERSIRIDLRKLASMTHSNVGIRIIRKYYANLVQKLNIIIPDVITDTDNYLLRIAAAAGKSDDSMILARKIIELADRSGNATAGRHPAAVAAAALYLACIKLCQSVTEVEISDAAGVTPAALRHSLKYLRNSSV